MTISIEAIPKPKPVEDRQLSEPAPGLAAWPLWMHAAIVLLLTTGAFFLFEWVGSVVYSGLAPASFRALALVAAGTVAGGSAYLGLRRLKAGERRFLEATMARYRTEESCNEVRQQLAEKNRAEQELRGAHQLLQAALDALSKHVAILDDQGTIIAVNQAWRRFADENGFVANYGLGSKYLDFVNRSADPDAGATGRGLAEVLQGQAERFRVLYPCIAPGGQRWFQLQVSRFIEGGSRRLLVIHEDVTEIKLAQEAQRDIDNRILQSREEERRKIARELHDSSVQKIFAVNLNLMGLKTLLGNGEKRIQDLLGETLSLGRECMQELRTTSYLLRPPLPAGHDFLPALNSYIDGFCKRSGIRVNLVLPSHAGRMPANVENALFRVVQETLSNIHRHSQSATATVLLRKNEEQVILEVRDKGKGMPGTMEAGTYRTTGGGLAGIEERVRELGGALTIQAASPGTVITATIPLAGINAQRDVSA
jgi:signal transduction histidine kinase